jgi:hypothetical protein
MRPNLVYSVKLGWLSQHGNSIEDRRCFISWNCFLAICSPATNDRPYCSGSGCSRQNLRLKRRWFGEASSGTLLLLWLTEHSFPNISQRPLQFFDLGARNSQSDTDVIRDVKAPHPGSVRINCGLNFPKGLQVSLLPSAPAVEALEVVQGTSIAGSGRPQRLNAFRRGRQLLGANRKLGTTIVPSPALGFGWLGEN